MKLRRHFRIGLMLTLVLAPAASTLAQDSKCRVEPFQGATLPSGAVAQTRQDGSARPSESAGQSRRGPLSEP